MKKNHIYTGLALSVLALSACSDFDEVNSNPLTANIGQVKIEYALNNAITGAQQDPHIGERIFSLTWMATSHMANPNMLSGIAVGDGNDGWNGDYYRYISDWLNSANLAITLADTQLKQELSKADHDKAANLKQVARIWRAYLMSEFVDNFGAIPIKAFQGENTSYNSCEDAYNYMLQELKEASAALDTSIKPSDDDKVYDHAYTLNYGKWRKYAVSMRMRLAMRLSEVAPAKAKAEFEDAVKQGYISNLDDNFAVKETKGWDPLTGVMSREWDDFSMSATVNNLMVGLGGITSQEQLSNKDKKILEHIKSLNYMGVHYDKHFTLNTNDPAKGFFFDGLYNTIDPRAYNLFSIPGDFDDNDYTKYPSWREHYKKTDRNLFKTKDKKEEDKIVLHGAFTWNAPTPGSWGEVGGLNEFQDWPYAHPGLKLRFRNSTNARIFFAAWESYFLIAEAAERGWSVPMGAKEAYEQGIKLNFESQGLQKYAAAYIQSESYNNVGTSVKWDHTTAAPSTKMMTMVNGYTGTQEQYEYHYPVASKTLYGKNLNDHLSKIITQKYLANMPWLPLEAWNDQRRLGLPFFETPAVEQAITTMPSLNKSNYEEQKIAFFPQRLKFPSNFEQSSPRGYAEAVKLLGGPDAVSTPIWWAKH